MAKKPFVTLAYVASVNGKITLGQNPAVTAWNSKEDRAHFSKLVKEHPVIILSSAAYEPIKKYLKHQKGKLRLVMTRHPQKYAEDTIPGQLEFTSKSPQALVADLKSRGVKKILLATGGQLTAKFLQAKLVDRLLLTLEPQLFGSGTPLIAESALRVTLKLLKVTRLNAQGTLLLTYKIE
ncbi:MAG: dihydrofolate reductase [Candidatus Chisholmbacteria bacterium]|nr:dihydrofolate reductase [Candidatus Chisholmbacteria bacterium]